MFKDCMEVFQKELDREGGSDRLVLDNYITKPGTYILAEITEEEIVERERLELSYDKKKNIMNGSESTLYPYIKKLDYYSQLFGGTNKCIDSKKQIQSNQYLSFIIKKESLGSKLTNVIIDGYFNTLKHPETKYTNKKAREIYESVEASYGKTDEKLIDRICEWIKKNIMKLDVDITQKDYLKIFFVFSNQEETLKRYVIEGDRYLIPNVYNKNDFNIFVNDEVYGVPNNNLGMNSKKPYLEHKTRKQEVPNLLNMKEAVYLKKFFDFVDGCAAQGYVYLYGDKEKGRLIPLKNGEIPNAIMNGFFMRIEITKSESLIRSWDTIVGFTGELHKRFCMKNIMQLSAEYTDKYDYGTIVKNKAVEELLDTVLFAKRLSYSYFTEAKDISIDDGTLKRVLVNSRDTIFAWLYKGEENGVIKLLINATLELAKNSILRGHGMIAGHQLNLLFSLIDYQNTDGMEESMESRVHSVVESFMQHIETKEEWGFDDDDEYYFAIGQLVYYFSSLSKAREKPSSVINPYINAKNVSVITRKLVEIFKKYNYRIMENYWRIRNVISAVLEYEPTVKPDQKFILCGYVHKNYIYGSKKGENENE